MKRNTRGVGLENKLYRRLQKHLDRQPVGFPSTRSGAELRILAGLFTPDEARLALRLSYQPAPLRQVQEQTQPEFEPEQTEQMLESMFMKGAIARKEQAGTSFWHLMPLVVGMYETQASTLTRRFLVDTHAYMRSLSFGKAFLAVKPSQMRTIPVNRSIPVEHHLATYDQIRAIVDGCKGPFIVLPCICRQAKALQHQPCKQTSRKETCLGFGDTAAAFLRRGRGREITRDETLDILHSNEEDGLVLQPANAQKPEFVCSCCGCCCGMLSVHRLLPHPIDFWTSNTYAEADATACVGCGKCVDRCQVNAMSVAAPDGKVTINHSRCIGCGLCVSSCPVHALRLLKKESQTVPPKDEQALYTQIMANKKGALAQLCMLLKVALKWRQ